MRPSVRSNDAVIIATGATVARDLPIKGRQLEGVHFAMEFLHKNTKSLLDSELADGEYISAKDKHVIVIGGGDTGNDCIGTSVRHGCQVGRQLRAAAAASPRARPRQPLAAVAAHLPRRLRPHEVATAHRQGPREYCIMSEEFVDDGTGRVKGINTVRVEWTKRLRAAGT